MRQYNKQYYAKKIAVDYHHGIYLLILLLEAYFYLWAEYRTDDEMGALLLNYEIVVERDTDDSILLNI